MKLIPLKYYFPLILKSVCPRCNHEEEVCSHEEEESGFPSGKLYACKQCGYDISRDHSIILPHHGMEYYLLNYGKDSFLEKHEKTILKALDLNSSFNSFGKRKIDYSTFIPELLEFFEDNFEWPTPDEFGDLKFRASISKEGVDELAKMLEAMYKDERN